jgi:putative ABC transport system permease protein
VAAVPGVARAAASVTTPVGGLGIVDIVHAPGVPGSFQPMTDGKLGDRSTFVNVVTPGWFATYGTPIKAGRDFDDRDVRGAPSVIVVNETFVRKFLRGTSPIGATIAFERGRAAPVPKTVAGVVADTTYGSLRAGNVPVEYAPLAQVDFPGLTPRDYSLSVRARSESPMLLAHAIAGTLTAVDPDLVFGFRPLTDQVAASLTQERLVAILSGFLGALALFLAGIGLYGMTAYLAASRRTEIGVRMALGATRPAIVRLMVARAVIVVSAGILIGAGVSAWASRFVARLLYGVEPRDPLTLVGASVVLVVVGTPAAWLPAFRASRADPATVLRES